LTEGNYSSAVVVYKAYTVYQPYCITKSQFNFNGFRVLAALLHGILVVSVSQTAALNRGRHLYSAGRPSRWALAHISSDQCFNTNYSKRNAFGNFRYVAPLCAIKLTKIELRDKTALRFAKNRTWIGSGV